MDVRRFKNPVARLVQWPGGGHLSGSCAGSVELRVLSPTEIEQAEQRAIEILRVEGLPPKGVIHELVMRACIIAAAASSTYEEVSGACDAPTLARLWDELCCSQRGSYPQGDEEMARLDEDVRRRTARATTRHARPGDSEILEDAKRAYLSPSAYEFYGRAVSLLTEGQVLYYTLARGAFREFYADPDKHVSVQWLTANDG